MEHNDARSQNPHHDCRSWRTGRPSHGLSSPPADAGTFPASSLDGTNGFRLAGVTNGGIGGSVAGAGDLNGDGADDIIIGDPTWDTRCCRYSGASFVVFGRSSGFPSRINLSRLDGTKGF